MWEYGFSDAVFVLVFQLVAWKIFGGICVALSECVFIKKEDFDIFYFVLCCNVYYFRRIIVM